MSAAPSSRAGRSQDFLCKSRDHNRITPVGQLGQFRLHQQREGRWWVRKFSRACCSERGTPTPQTPCPWSTKSRAIVTQHGMGSAGPLGCGHGRAAGRRPGGAGIPLWRLLGSLCSTSWDSQIPTSEEGRRAGLGPGVSGGGGGPQVAQEEATFFSCASPRDENNSLQSQLLILLLGRIQLPSYCFVLSVAEQFSWESDAQL